WRGLKMRRSTALATSLVAMVAAGAASAGSFTFTNDADWDTGSYSSTNSGPPGADDQVQLDPNIVTQFDFIWVAASGRGTAVLIDTDYDDATDGIVNDGVASLAESQAGSGAVLGEYRTAPSGRATNPSRTTVDINGDVWIGNRDESSGGLGSAVKITATPGEGATTSSGTWNGSTFDALAWTNAGGADNLGGTSTAQDDAIELYIRTPSTNNRTIAIDANNDVWIGGYGDKEHAKYDGDTGAQIGSSAFGGGYGGVIDGNGILWSSNWSSNTIYRYDTTAADAASGALSPVTTGGPSYGLGVDNDGNIWNTHYSNRTVSKLAPDGTLLATYSSGGYLSRGVAVTPDNTIWIANSGDDTVTRLATDGTLLATIRVGDYPTGVSVDSNGKVWVTNQGNGFNGNSVMRIDPAMIDGSVPANVASSAAVDLRVDLGAGANPYNYSDMTGSLVGGITNPTGTWLSGAIDGGVGAIWDKVFWNEEAEGLIPTGSDIDVFVRVADTIAGLSGGVWTSYESGDTLNLAGQYAQIRAVLTRPGGPGAATPILSDVRLTTFDGGVVPLPATAWLLFGGIAALVGFGRRRQA
ncbi:MAG: VPLPA-CTERM sorting domain-containing protein, partial [Rhodovulum sp.]